MGTLLMFGWLLTSPPAAGPITSMDEVLALLDRGLPAAAVAAEIDAAGVLMPLTPKGLVELHTAGAPELVLSALVAASGAVHPEIHASPGQLELLYDGYRIVGRRGPAGPLLTVTGYASDGSRLKPPVPPAPIAPSRVAEATQEAELEFDAVVAAPEPRRRRPDRAHAWQPEPATVDGPYAAPTIQVNVNLRTAEPPYPQPATFGFDPRFTHGAPDYVTVTQVPPQYLTRGTLVTPFNAPAFGFGHLGYGSPWFGAYAPFANCGAGPGGLATSYVRYDYAPAAVAAPPPSARQQIVRQRIRH